MDDFKIKSLDDFDSMFMSSKKPAASAQPAAPAETRPQQPAFTAAPVQQAQTPVQQAQPTFTAAPVQQAQAPAFTAAPAPSAKPAAPKKESLIPEMETGPVEINFFEIDGVPVGAAPAPAQQKPASNVYSAAPVTPAQPAAPAQTAASAASARSFGTAPQSVQPPVSLYQSEGMKDNSVNQFLYQPERTDDIDDDYDEDKKSGKGNALPMVGKIASIVMLAVTLIIFVLGCFITIFLNNKDSKCGSICFATLSEDVSGISGGKNDTITKGSLVICKSVDISGYAVGDIVAVPTTEDGCTLYQVVAADAGTGFITVADPSNTSGASQSFKTDDIYGMATYNFGGLGKVIQFASNNAILVCILFLLLAALWCLFIILIEKSQEKKAAAEENDDDESDNGGLSF